MQSIRITSGPPLKIRKNQFSKFRWISTKEIPTKKKWLKLATCLGWPKDSKEAAKEEPTVQDSAYEVCNHICTSLHMPKASDTSHIARVLIMKMTFSYVVYRMSQFKRFLILKIMPSTSLFISPKGKHFFLWNTWKVSYKLLKALLK